MFLVWLEVNEPCGCRKRKSHTCCSARKNFPFSFLPQHHYKFPTKHMQWLIMFVCFSIWNLILYVKLSSEGYISLNIIPLATQEHSLSIKKKHHYLVLFGKVANTNRKLEFIMKFFKNMGRFFRKITHLV